MNIPTPPVRSLTFAISLGLALPSVSADVSRSFRASLETAPTAVVVDFGGPEESSAPTGRSVTRAASQLTTQDIDRLSVAVPGSVLGLVSASALPLADAEAVTLQRLFASGTPILVQMDARTSADLGRVSALFGIAPTSGEVLLRRRADGQVNVYSAPAGATAGPTALLGAMLAATSPAARGRVNARTALVADAPASDGTSLMPGRHFDINFVDPDGEVAGVTGIDVVRSRTASMDNKFVSITSKATVKPAKVGIVDGGKTNQNLWGAYLPIEYRLRHSLTADGVRPTYIDHFPETDGSTEFTQVDTENRGFTIGGSTGAELSATGKPDDALASKLPLNLSLSYEQKWQTSLSTTFKDYSLLAAPEGDGSVQWKALISPKLTGVLIKRIGADLPTLTDQKITPMMRAATINAVSQWKIPGAYEGMAKVSVSAGYSIDRDEWFWQGVDVKRREETDVRNVATDFVVDLSDPYLSAEITVLIRSAEGSGACLRDNGGRVDLAACNAMDRRQMWGLDPVSRYVNRGSGRCLSAQPSTEQVVTEACANVTSEKQWQWRADRLHSLVSHGNYRLYVDQGQVRYAAPEGRFQDYPVNPYGAPLEPWTNYPNAPRPGIDSQPAPAGSRPLPLGSEWGSMFRRVSDDQRWRIETLRQGL